MTELKAIDPADGIMKKWCGPNIEAISWAHAGSLIQDRGYLVVIGQLTQEIPCKKGIYEPDFDNAVNHDNLDLKTEL